MHRIDSNKNHLVLPRDPQGRNAAVGILLSLRTPPEQIRAITTPQQDREPLALTETTNGWAFGLWMPTEHRSPVAERAELLVKMITRATRTPVDFERYWVDSNEDVQRLLALEYAPKLQMTFKEELSQVGRQRKRRIPA